MLHKLSKIYSCFLPEKSIFDWFVIQFPKMIHNIFRLKSRSIDLLQPTSKCFRIHAGVVYKELCTINKSGQQILYDRISRIIHIQCAYYQGSVSNAEGKQMRESPQDCIVSEPFVASNQSLHAVPDRFINAADYLIHCAWEMIQIYFASGLKKLLHI